MQERWLLGQITNNDLLGSLFGMQVLMLWYFGPFLLTVFALQTYRNEQVLLIAAGYLSVFGATALGIFGVYKLVKCMSFLGEIEFFRADPTESHKSSKTRLMAIEIWLNNND